MKEFTSLEKEDVVRFILSDTESLESKFLNSYMMFRSSIKYVPIQSNLSKPDPD